MRRRLTARRAEKRDYMKRELRVGSRLLQTWSWLNAAAAVDGAQVRPDRVEYKATPRLTSNGDDGANVSPAGSSGPSVTFPEWVRGVPESIRGDSVWKIEAYRLALFLGDLAWHDTTHLARSTWTIRLAGQLLDAAGSVGANIAEGFSRGTGKDRARFYEYALGSAREARHWYYQARHSLGEEVFHHRAELCRSLTRLLLAMIPDQRAWSVREERAEYTDHPNGARHRDNTNEDALLL